MIKINLEMEVKDLVELVESGFNVSPDFEKKYQEAEAYIRKVREEVAGTDRVDESFEDIQDRIKKEIYGAQQDLKLNEIKEFKFQDLCTHKSEKGATTLVDTEDGVVCTLCNKRFKLVSEDNKENKKAIVQVNNMIESIKAYNLEISEDEILELARLQSVLNTLESKLDKASKTLDKYVSKITLQPVLDPNHPLSTEISHRQSFSLLPYNRLW